MKKALAIMLSVLVVFSMFSVMAFAEDGSTAESTPITVKFMDGESVVKEFMIKSGELISPTAPANPTKPDSATTRYTFTGWLAYDEAGNLIDEKLYQKSTLPTYSVEEGDTMVVIFKAQYAEKNISGYQTLLNFIESIFERINMIFAYFAEIFGF